MHHTKDTEKKKQKENTPRDKWQLQAQSYYQVHNIIYYIKMNSLNFPSCYFFMFFFRLLNLFLVQEKPK